MDFVKSQLFYLLIICTVGLSSLLDAQVAINETGNTANSESILDINSSTKGLLIPRMTTAQRTTFTTGLGLTEKSMLIFDTDLNIFYFWNGTSFTEINSGNIDKIQNTAGNSVVKLTTSSGSDVVDIKLENTDFFRFQQGGLEMLNNGKSVFLGETAGQNDDFTDNENVFVGYGAGSSNTSGFYNIATGYDALRDNTTGTRNTAIGYWSMLVNTTGYDNTSLGYSALKLCLTSNSNTAIGTSSMQALNSGSANTALGGFSLYQTTSGTSNVAVGEGSGTYLETGNNNTFIGYGAGKGSSLHSQSGNVFLGYLAGYSETGSNKLYIENSNSSTPLIGGDFSTNRVDINGTLKITGGSPGANKYLLSDVSGNATWSTVSLNVIDNVISDDTSVYIGYLAGNSDNGGNYSVGIGRKALENSTGYANVAMGSKALNTNTVGSYNVAIGWWALKLNSLSSSNIAIGAQSLEHCTGSTNVAIGSNASSSNTSGQSNVSIGHSTNSLNQTGSRNTIVGSMAGRGTGLHSKSGNVFLGYKAGYSEINSNKLYIDNSDTTKPLIGGDFSTNNVDINGTIKIAGGSPGINKILTSDANGNASWQANVAATQLNDLSDASSDGFSVFVGSEAGAVDDGENYNAAVGKDALTMNNSGTYNSAIGSRSLFSNTTGINNSCVGRRALFSNTTAKQNTAMGAQALYYNNVDDNSAFGFHALYSSTTGINNTATGSQALYSNTTGHNNDAHGYQALLYNLSGYYNQAFGVQALQNNTTGIKNIAIGYEAGIFGDVNSNCTYIGYQSKNAAITSYSNSSAFGSQSALTADNQVRVGNSNVTSIGGYAAWTNISDKRFKSNIKEDVKGLEFILKLRPITYNLDIDKINDFLNITEYDKVSASKKSAQRQTGFIAQEVEKSANELGFEFSGVDKPKNENDHYGLRYSQFVVPLVKAVQELNDKNEKLEKENTLLKARLDRIEKKLNMQN